jgi:aminoglycoside phosphotransferase (APT) family kinase protein
MNDRLDRVRHHLAAVVQRFDDGERTVLHGGNCVVVMTPAYVARGGFAGAVTTFEIDVIMEARRVGLPAPDVLDTGDLADGGMYMVYRRLPGQPVGDAMSWQSLADAIRTLHTRAHPEVFPGQPMSLEARAMRPAHALEMARSGTVPRWIAEAIALIVDTTGESRVPVHGDLRPSNVLVDDTGRVSGLIDWSDAHLGDCEEDIAFLDPELWPVVAHGYCRGTSLTLDQRRLVGHGAARVVSLEARKVLAPGSVNAWVSRAERILSEGLWPVVGVLDVPLATPAGGRPVPGHHHRPSR